MDTSSLFHKNKTFSLFHAHDDVFGVTINGGQVSRDKYELVATFDKKEVPTLDAVYCASQNIDDAWCYPEQRSTSVGDLICDDDTGEIWMVDMMGFKPYTAS